MTLKGKAYKDYFDAVASRDVFNEEEARKKIEYIKEIESYGGSCNYEGWDEMGG